MNIAHVLPSFELGGQERLVLALARAQHRAGHGVTVVSLAAGDGSLGPALRSSGVQTATVEKRRGFDASLPERLARAVVRAGVELVHTHNLQPLVYAALAARSARAAVVHTRHGDGFEPERRRWMERVAAHWVDAYVAVSAATQKFVQRERLCPSGRLHLIENGIELDEWRPAPALRPEVRRELDIPASAFVIAAVGRLAPEKDHALLLRAAAPLLEAGTHVIVIGDGPEMPALRALAGASPLPGAVHLLGARSDVRRLLAAVDVFVQPSRREGLPLAVLEAMAMELPVIATAVGGMPEVVREGETGLLVPPGDETALRTQLERLRAGDGAALGRHARALVEEQYGMARTAGLYQRLYASLRKVMP